MTSSNRRLAVAAVLAVTGLVLAACSGSTPKEQNFAGTSSDSSLSASASGSASASAAHSSGAKSSAAKSSSHAAHVHVSTLPNGKTTTAQGGSGGGGGTGGGGGGGGSHSTAPASNCATSTTAGAQITVCPYKSLHDGQQVKITGKGFDPKYLGGQLLAVQCHYLGEQATRYGASQCNLNAITFAGAVQTSTKDGTVGPIYLTLKEQFKSINCATEQCLVSVSPPNPNPPSTDNPHVLIYFG